MIEYDGTDFYGWQVQPGKRTVQGEIEKALSIIFGERIKVRGSGRTDTGVHALGQVANSFVPPKLSPERLKRALNGTLPRDVYIKEVTPVPPDFDARFSAISRIYLYRILRGRSPLKRRYVLELDYEVDVERMREIARILPGRRNFKYLAMKDEGECDLKRVEIKEKGEEIHVEVEANRFLRRMVRGIVGLLLQAGRGKILPEDVERILKGEKRKPPFAPAHGLYLVRVVYPTP